MNIDLLYVVIFYQNVHYECSLVTNFRFFDTKLIVRSAFRRHSQWHRKLFCTKCRNTIKYKNMSLSRLSLLIQCFSITPREYLVAQVLLQSQNKVKTCQMALQNRTNTFKFATVLGPFSLWSLILSVFHSAPLSMGYADKINYKILLLWIQKYMQHIQNFLLYNRS